MNCPECGSTNVQVLGKRNWPYPFALLAIIGPTFAFFHQAASPIDYHCPVCGLHFARRSAAARLVLFTIWFFVLGIIMQLAILSLHSITP